MQSSQLVKGERMHINRLESGICVDPNCFARYDDVCLDPELVQWRTGGSLVLMPAWATYSKPLSQSPREICGCCIQELLDQRQRVLEWVCHQLLVLLTVQEDVFFLGFSRATATGTAACF